MYPLLRKALFALPAETSHNLTLELLGAAERLRLLPLLCRRQQAQPVEVMGLRFPNRVGLAAGLDKNGDYFNALGALGFGFVEIGTVTPRPQPGNPRPRLFRLEPRDAIINRMGFNNLGVEHLVSRVRCRRYPGILGINIGKNADTPVARAVDDYLLGMNSVYDHADYIAVNISSPNTPGLRSLQLGDSLAGLLAPLVARGRQLADSSGRRVPLVVKIAPDLDEDEIRATARVLVAQGVDGVIATNTTTGREGVEDLPQAAEAGGLSGAPVRDKSTAVIRVLADVLEGRLPIIGVGGIMAGEDAVEKIRAGASLVQIYTGLIYRGPALARESVAAIDAMGGG